MKRGSYLQKIEALLASHPLRVRGLKLGKLFLQPHLLTVAPFTGAWIETAKRCKDMARRKCRTLYGCVD